MRITAYPVVESDIEFDFAAAIWCDQHDRTNTIYPGVDFILDEPDRQIWLEVKNWQGASIPSRRRGGLMRSFQAKMKSGAYFNDTLRAKFIGTCAYLALTNAPPQKPILYVALLESSRMDRHMMSVATTRLRNLVTHRSLTLRVDAIVVSLAEWRARFPEYPARAL